MEAKLIDPLMPRKARTTIALRLCQLVACLTSTTTLLLASAVSRADTIYASAWLDTTIYRYTSAGAGSVFKNTGLYFQTGLAFDSMGNLYAANRDNHAPSGNGSIQKVTPSGVTSSFATGLYQPEGLAFDRAGNLYVADFNKVLKITPTGAPSIFATGMAAPKGLALDSAGNLYVANWYSNTIRKISPTGADLGVFATTGLNGPGGLAFDSAGNLYAANRNNSTIWRYTPSGVGSLFASTGLNTPIGLVFDSAGNLYAANEMGYSIEKFSPTGTDLGVFANAAYAPEYLAIQPVPEPSTLALLGLGAPALIVLRRRKK